MPTRTQLLILWLIALVACFASMAWAPVAILIGSPRGSRILVAADRMMNATSGGLDTETISSRAWRGTQEGRRGWCLLCWIMGKIEKDHCKISAGI